MHRIPRRLRGVIIGLVVASIPMAAVATDVFTDVPDTSSFHDVINVFAGAGITAGDPSGSTTFQPRKNVNRQQMAAFINRAAGRVAYSGNGTSVDIQAEPTIASVTLTPGGAVAGKTNFVKVNASFTVTCVTDCQSIVVLLHDGTNNSRGEAFTLGTGESEDGSITWVTEVTTGADVTLTLSADGGGGQATAVGELSAEYVPFGPDGGNALTPAP